MQGLVDFASLVGEAFAILIRRFAIWRRCGFLFAARGF
jgi:hypothetical protein